MLLLSSVPVDQWAGLIPNLETVVWTWDDLDPGLRGHGTTVRRAQYVAEYSRSADEAEFVAAFLSLVTGEYAGPDTPQRQLIKRVMLNALASSRSALEQVLLRQYERAASSLAKQDLQEKLREPTTSELEEEIEVDDPSEVSRMALWNDPDEAARHLKALIAQLDALPADSKATSLRALVERLTREEPSAPICVFASFASTAEYVAEILGDGSNVLLMTGAMSYAERARVAASFGSDGGILVTTQIAEGLDFSVSHCAIHYDLPELRSNMEQRWGRLDRFRQRETVRSFAFRDSKHGFEWEEALLRRHGFVA